MQLSPDDHSSAQTDLAWFSANSINLTLQRGFFTFEFSRGLLTFCKEAGKLPSCSGAALRAFFAAICALSLFLKAPICINQSSDSLMV